MPEYSQICHMAVWSRQGWVPKMLTHMQDLTQKHSFIAGSMIAETKLGETRKWTNKQNTQPANEGDRDTRLQKLNTGVNQSKVKTPGEHSWQQSNSWDRGKQTWTRIGYYQSKTGSMGNTHTNAGWWNPGNKGRREQGTRDRARETDTQTWLEKQATRQTWKQGWANWGGHTRTINGKTKTRNTTD